VCIVTYIDSVQSPCSGLVFFQIRCCRLMIYLFVQMLKRVVDKVDVSVYYYQGYPGSDGKHMAMGTGSGDLHIWTLSDMQLTRSIVRSVYRSVSDCSYSPDGGILVTASSDCSLKILSVRNGEYTSRHHLKSHRQWRDQDMVCCSAGYLYLRPTVNTITISVLSHC